MRASHLLAFSLGSLALAASAQPQSPCPVEGGVQDIWGQPVPIETIRTGQPIAATPGAVLAVEKLQLATKIWRTRTPINLPKHLRFNYPAGVPVTALRTDEGERKCLRDTRPSGAGPARGSLMACLVDANGDGLYERAELFKTNLIITRGQRSRFQLSQAVQLDPAVALFEDVQGLGFTRMFAFRRIRITEAAGDQVKIVAELATQDASDRPYFPAYKDASGKIVLKAQPRSEGARGLPPAYKPQRGSERTINLADGNVEEIAGIRLRIGRGQQGWTMTPLDPRFPSWIQYECEGSRLRIGVSRS